MAEPTLVEIVRYNPERPDEPDILIRCRLIGEEVHLEAVDQKGGLGIIKEFIERGIFSLEGEKVFPKDGRKFLNSLRLHFRHPYLYAREIE